MKIFDIKAAEIPKVILFSLLCILIEISIALSLSAGEALFIGDVGVEGLPMAFIMLFGVMLAAMGIISYAQSKMPLRRVLIYLFSFFAFFVTFLAAAFTFYSPEGIFATFLLYSIKLGASVWMYAGFSLYWNFADEYFNIREGKRLYSLFAAFGCIGAVLGAGAVFVFSEYLKINTAYLLWIWAVCIFAAIPVISTISNTCLKLDSGMNFETASDGFVTLVVDNVRAMNKSPYIRAILFMYIAVIVASAINEYVAMSAFSEYATTAVKEIATTLTPQQIIEDSQLRLASLFGALCVGVNVFNFLINLLFFNRLVSRFGVGNIAILQSILFIIAFIWLINSFGIAAAVFSFFIYRGTLESIDANNENLMVSILPGALRQQVRLMIEVFIVPFATAIAGVFLMFYVKGETSINLDAYWFGEYFSSLGFGSLDITGVSIVGFFIAFIGLIFALLSRKEYPRVLENNLRSGWIDFSKTLKDISLSDSDFDAEKILKSLGNDKSKILSFCEIAQYKNPKIALSLILNNSQEYVGDFQYKAAKIIENLLSLKNFDVTSEAIEWLIDSSKNHPYYATLLVARSGALARMLNFNRHEEDSKIIDEALTFQEKSYSAYANFWQVKDLSAESKVDYLNSFSGKNIELDFVVDLLNDSHQNVREAAISALARSEISGHSYLANEVAVMFNQASKEIESDIFKVLEKVASEDCIETFFKGVSRMTPHSKRLAFSTFSMWGDACVPALVAIIRSQNYSYEAKTVCAQILNKVFPSQLKMLAEDLIDAELKNAYSYVADEISLEELGAYSEALRKILRWKQRSALSYIIAVLAYCGKLPSAETITSGLFSHSGKDVGNAIEIIEQGTHRHDFERLLPLLDGRSLYEKFEAAKKIYKLKRRSVSEILTDAYNSDFDEDFLASISILFAQKSESIDAILCKKIGTLKNCALRDDLLELVDFSAFCKISNKSNKLNSDIAYPHIFSALNMCGYFDGFESSAIYELLDKVKISTQKSYIFKDASIIITSNSRGLNDAEYKEISAGETYSNDDSSEFFFISKKDIFDVAGDFPESALSIYYKYSKEVKDEDFAQ